MNDDYLLPSMEDLCWLLSAEAAPILDEMAPRDTSDFGVVSELHKRIGQDRAVLLLQQIELRRRARVKFPEADRMFFTPLGLEQATDGWVAAYKASRIPRATGSAPLGDFCCGIGGDLSALARDREAIGIERDPIVALFARANAELLGATSCDVRTEDVAEIDPSEFATWHIDPDRRPGGSRTTHLEMQEPSLETLESLLSKNPNAVMKLAPASDLPEEWTSRCQSEWISRDRQCRQQVAWFGDCAETPGLRKATRVFGNAASVAIDSSPSDVKIDFAFVTGEGERPLPRSPESAWGRYLFEPDPAVLAADLTGDLAEQNNLTAPNLNIPYLTSDTIPETRLLSTFEIEAVLPLDRKRVRRLMAERKIGRLEIKKRGVKINPEQLRKELKLKGSESAVLLVLPIGKSVTAVLAKRISIR